MKDAKLVLRETGLFLKDFPERLQDLTANLCRLSMGELLVLTEQVEAVDAKKGAMVRQVWERRRDWAELRSLLRPAP